MFLCGWVLVREGVGGVDDDVMFLFVEMMLKSGCLLKIGMLLA
jgi:hypothetical protein